MQTHEIAILAISAGGVLAVVVWTLYSGLRTRWPGGMRLDITVPKTADTEPIVVHGFFAKTVPADQQFLHAAGSAIWAAAVAWKVARALKRVTKDDSPTRRVVVYVETADVMEAKAKALGFRSIAGYITKHQTRNWAGDLLPMIVISELHLSEVIKTGEPVIHEMLHALERDYVAGKDDHGNPVVWEAAAAQEGITLPSVQATARQVYAGALATASLSQRP